MSKAGSLLSKFAIVSAVAGLLVAVGSAVFSNLPPEVSKLVFSLEMFLVGAGVAMSLLSGVMILINAFRESIWWGLGFFAPFVGWIVSLVFIFRNWSQNGMLFLANLGGCILAVVGMVMVGATGFQYAMDNLEMSVSEYESSGLAGDMTDAMDAELMLLITFDSATSRDGATAESVLAGVNYDQSAPATLLTVSDVDAPYQSQLSLTLLNPDDRDSAMQTIGQSPGVKNVEDYGEKIATIMAEKFKEALGE